MYDINVKFVKKGKWFWWIFLLAGLLFMGIIIFSVNSTGNKIKTLDSKVLSSRVDVTTYRNDEGKIMYRPMYYYQVDGNEYICSSNVSTSSEPNLDNKTIYYKSDNPSRCMLESAAKNNNKMYFVLFIPGIFVIIGLIGILNINKRVKAIKELNKKGKLIKNLNYTLVDSNMRVNGVSIKRPLVKYTLPTGLTVDLYGDPRHDKKHFDKDGLVDLVIDENNPTNYFIDFDINRIGGNLPSDYYVDPKKEVEEKIEDGYITNNEAKYESLEYTVVSEEEFNRLRNE